MRSHFRSPQRDMYIKRQVLTSEDVTVRMKKNVFRWFGYVERMSDKKDS